MPWTYMTFEPMPSIAAPILLSMRARSWTWGSEAALRMTLEPGVSAAAMSAFSVPITDGSSMKKSVERSPPLGAESLMWRSCSTSAPSARKASRCGSRRRRPMTSPPGGGIDAEPKRASSGPATRKEARMRSASSGSTSVSSIPSACSETVLSSIHSTVTPRSASSASIASVSRMRGTLAITTRSSVSKLAARSGRAAFLLPAGTMVPDSGTPPWMTSFSMVERAATVPAMSHPLSRAGAASLLVALALAAAPSPAGAAADVPVAEVGSSAALAVHRDTLAWIEDDGPETVVLRHPDGRTQRLPASDGTHELSLGRDRRGRLVLVYARCATPRRCSLRRVDVRSGRSDERARHRRGDLPPGAAPRPARLGERRRRADAPRSPAAGSAARPSGATSPSAGSTTTAAAWS